jgi:hypothetical protein
MIPPFGGYLLMTAVYLLMMFLVIPAEVFFSPPKVFQLHLCNNAAAERTALRCYAIVVGSGGM